MKSQGYSQSAAGGGGGGHVHLGQPMAQPLLPAYSGSLPHQYRRTRKLGLTKLGAPCAILEVKLVQVSLTQGGDVDPFNQR